MSVFLSSYLSWVHCSSPSIARLVYRLLALLFETVPCNHHTFLSHTFIIFTPVMCDHMYLLETLRVALLKLREGCYRGLRWGGLCWSQASCTKPHPITTLCINLPAINVTARVLNGCI